MAPRDSHSVVASMATSYIRRFLEPHYWKFEERFGDRIHRIPARHRKAIEAVLYFINAHVERHLPEDSIPEKVLKGVLPDVAPELGVCLNGRRSHRRQDPDLSNLTEEELAAFLDWCEDVSDEDRKVFLDAYGSPQQLGWFLALPPDLRERFVAHIIAQKRRPPRKPLIPDRIGFIDWLNARLSRERRMPCSR